MLAQVLNVLRMIFQMILCFFNLLVFVLNFFFLFCNLFIPWLAIGVLFLLFATKFIKLKDPDREIIDELLACTNNKQEENNEMPSTLEFPIANKYIFQVFLMFVLSHLFFLNILLTEVVFSMCQKIQLLP